MSRIPHGGIQVLNLFNGHAINPPLQLDKPPPFPPYMSAIAGLLGGDDAVSAITAVHVYGHRRWLGWYNNPGSFKIAKRLRLLAKSVSIRNLSPTSLSSVVHIDPTVSFELDGCKGPRFRAVHLGTVIEETGYLATLFMKECVAWDLGNVVRGRGTQPFRVTVADLAQTPTSEMNPTGSNSFTVLFASVPISVSIGAYALCAARGDWYASSSILMGIVASGVSSLVLGFADFVFIRPESAGGSPDGDGILSSGNDIVLLRGTEDAVNSITRGRFFLRFSSEGHYNLIRSCSVLFSIQFITQFLLIPHASLFGHLMFLAAIGVSAFYNAWLSSPDRDEIHRRLLFEKVLKKPTMTKYTMGSRTTAVVFILLVLRVQNPMGLLNESFPNDNKVWKQWKATILEQLRHRDDPSLLESKTGDLDRFAQEEKELLQLLYDDAREAYICYRDYLQVQSL